MHRAEANSDKQEKSINEENKKIITGTITDSHGYPLIGANILVSGITMGTTTDFDGKFELQLGIDLIVSTLEITYVGYESQTLKITKERYQEVNVILETGLLLGEIVVVGYGVPMGGCAMGAITTGIEVSEEIDFEIENDTLTAHEEIYIQHIAPNPFTDTFKATIESSRNERFDFRLFSTKGRLLWEREQTLRKGKNMITVQLTKPVPVGTYIFHGNSKYRQISHKIIKHE